MNDFVKVLVQHTVCHDEGACSKDCNYLDAQYDGGYVCGLFGERVDDRERLLACVIAGQRANDNQGADAKAQLLETFRQRLFTAFGRLPSYYRIERTLMPLATERPQLFVDSCLGLESNEEGYVRATVTELDGNDRKIYEVTFGPEVMASL